MPTRAILTTLLLLLATIVHPQRRDIHILAVNDMHAAIDAMPRLAAIVDSLRQLYPSLLVFSAGDNRTGNPINDMHIPAGYPMVALMNHIGFDASAIGNHEFDSRSFTPLLPYSKFPYLCANIRPTRQTYAGFSDGKIAPYHIFNIDTLKIAVLGCVQTNERGTPNAHPDAVKGYRFTPPLNAVKKYQWLSSQCHATVLLSHDGYENDLQTAQQCPWLDLIIGGHTHTQLTDSEPLHNQVLVTQNGLYLSHATHITLTVDSGHVVGKQAHYINVARYPRQDTTATRLVRAFNDNPYFKHVLAHAAAPFLNRNEIGTMVCDALRKTFRADVCFINYRCIRLTSLPAGPITIGNVLQIDPYDDTAVVTTMTGQQLMQFILKYGRMATKYFPHLSGMSAQLFIDRNDTTKITHVQLLTANGKKPFNPRKTYRVVTNSYVLATGLSDVLSQPPHNTGKTTVDVLISYLRKRKTVDYQGKGSLRYF